MELKDSLLYSQEVGTALYPQLADPLCNLTPCLFDTHFNITLPSMLGLSSGHLPQDYVTKHLYVLISWSYCF
jgi:hypothetical protein